MPERRVDVRISPLRPDASEGGDPLSRCVLVTIQDVAPRDLTEGRALRAAKMECVGKLAGGLAHRLNNLLTGIIGYTDLVRECARPYNAGRNRLRRALSVRAVAPPGCAGRRALKGRMTWKARRPFSMRVDSIEIARVAMPLIYPFRTAFGDDETIESVLVRLSAGGLSGWGEGSSLALPAYSAECARTQFIISRDFVAPLLLGQEVDSGERLQGLLSGIKGNYFAKSAFDMAWWDLHAREVGRPLWQVLGGKDATVDVGADFGIMETIDLLLETIEAANRQGYKRIKLKYRPGWDLEMIDAVRNAFPDTTVHIDCNSAYGLDDLEMFKKLDRYRLAMIEQPLSHDDLIDHAKLQAAIETPVCLDESITSPDKARKAIRIKACRWVNIKPGRVGGTTNALAIHNICRDAGIPCWIGGMLESAVGASHCLALATLPNIRYPSDVFPTDRFYKRDLGTPPMVHSAPSQFRASEEPGIGARPDPKALAAFTLDHAILQG
ncbi:MAG: o-succinylbenzoate synthase [Candidatus Brocadiia bacterium]|nr:o-succinylbenzoate synthase [Candidatus Brocadiia bacterium]